jgi:outer membrane protein assembly factor BamB/predicted DNA-binding WGR domain protein
MSEEKTYLELSESGSSTHKFYEVIVNGAELSIRFGRIGDEGQKQVKTCASEAKALAEAQKKINEKLKKGYERATQGVRQKRAVTRRSAMLAQYAAASSQTSGASTGTAAARRASSAPKINQAPVLWKFESGFSAFGVFIDQARCWVGNEDGKIFALTHEGEVRSKFKLPEGVKCLVSDGAWLYAGCDDGNVYDLTGKLPRVAYEIAPNVDILWLDIADGVLAVSDDKGSVTVINHEDESQWSKKSKGDMGWMVRCDEIGVYHGHTAGVTMYDWEDGREIWQQETQGPVLFGWQEEATVYACTSRQLVHCFSKSGEVGTIYHCDAVLFSCAAAENGKYVFAGDNRESIYCFNEAGERLWKLATGCGAAYSMQYFNERLYIVTTFGTLACIDASEAAIQAAQAGTVPQAQVIAAPQVEEVSATALETTMDVSSGVVVECFKEGSNLRVRVISEGYNKNLHCQFPKGIREAGARYVVDEVREARGGFYRVLGDIKKLA